MPLLCFSNQRLDPDLPLADRLLIGLRRVVTLHPFQVGLIEAASYLAPVVIGRALALEPTGVAGGSRGPVGANPFGVFVRAEAQCLVTRTVVDIGFGIGGEVVFAEEGRLRTRSETQYATRHLALERPGTNGAGSGLDLR